MTLWHDRRGMPARGLLNPGVIFARHIKWVATAATDINHSQGPLPDEVNAALICTDPVEFSNGLHTYWIRSNTGLWPRWPNRAVWISLQAVPDLSLWARDTEDLPWIARWMNPKAHRVREYVPPGLSDLGVQYAKDIPERWRGVSV